MDIFRYNTDMKKIKLPRIKFYKPYFELYLRLPLIDIHTDVMSERFESNIFVYISLFVKVWKWEWKFRLYKPGYDRTK